MHWNRSCSTWSHRMMNSLIMISRRINCRKLITKNVTLFRPNNRQQSAPFHHHRLSNDTLSIARPNSIWTELQAAVGPLRKNRLTSNSLFHQHLRTLHRDGLTNKNSRRDIGLTVLVCNQVTCQRPCMMS